MFNYEDIYKMMREGKSSANIAKEFADNLNKAQAQITADRKKAEERAETEARLKEYAATIADAINNYIHLKFPDYSDDMRLTPDEAAQLLDEAFSTATSLHKHLTWFNDDETIANFLNKLRL